MCNEEWKWEGESIAPTTVAGIAGDRKRSPAPPVQSAKLAGDGKRSPALLGAMGLLVVALTAVCAPPAGTRAAHRAESGASILPGGREITPIGDQFFTGPGP